MRHYIIEDEDGWQVVDGWTHLVAAVAGRTLRGLTFHKADDLAELLNQGTQSRTAALNLPSNAPYRVPVQAAASTLSPK